MNPVLSENQIISIQVFPQLPESPTIPWVSGAVNVLLQEKA